MFKAYKLFFCCVKRLFETIAERTVFIDFDVYLEPSVLLKESNSEYIFS